MVSFIAKSLSKKRIRRRRWPNEGCCTGSAQDGSPVALSHHGSSYTVGSWTETQLRVLDRAPGPGARVDHSQRYDPFIEMETTDRQRAAHPSRHITKPARTRSASPPGRRWPNVGVTQQTKPSCYTKVAADDLIHSPGGADPSNAWPYCPFAGWQRPLRCLPFFLKYAGSRAGLTLGPCWLPFADHFSLS